MYLNPKFQASSSFLCLYSLVCVGPVRKPHCWFSHEAAHMSVELDVKHGIRLKKKKKKNVKLLFLERGWYNTESDLKKKKKKKKKKKNL